MSNLEEAAKHTRGPIRIAAKNYQTGFYLIHAIDYSDTAEMKREMQLLKIERGPHPIKEHLERAKADAEYLVEAWNNYEQQSERERGLIEALSAAYKLLNCVPTSYYRNVYLTGFDERLIEYNKHLNFIIEIIKL